MEGVKRYKVRLLPHNDQWSQEFQTVKKMLYSIWDDNVLNVQHVGSTAIPDICAKPILDVAVRLRSISNMDSSRLELLGYSNCGIQHGNPLYHLFVLRGSEEVSLQHIHCYDQSSPEFDQLVKFRDYLNSHPDIAKQYEELIAFRKEHDMDLICVEHLTRDYGGGNGIFDITFQVKQGEAFGFLGPNGAGKTTTLRHLMGFIRPKSGNCTIRGMDCWTDRCQIQKHLGYIPGEISFFDDMTGTEFLNFFAKYRGLPSKNREKELLDRFELNTRSKIKKMSKGMKQKLCIVTAFMHDPDILILDEPTSGLDPLMQNRFIDLIVEEKQRGKTILLSSHMIEEIERTCDRIGIIRDGKLAAVDTVETLRSRHLRSYRVTLENESIAKSFAADFGGECDGRFVTVCAKQSLEDIFLHYYGGNQSND